MNWVEWLGFGTGFLCVYFNIRQNIRSFPIALVSVVAYAVVFYRSRLYGDMALQILFMANILYGWYCWMYGKNADDTPLKPTFTSGLEKVVLLLFTAFCMGMLVYVLEKYTDSDMVWPDAFTTALSITAQYMLARKKIENWLLWFVADVVYVFMYVHKQLYLTAVLYFIYLIMCVLGYWAWVKSKSGPWQSVTK